MTSFDTMTMLAVGAATVAVLFGHSPIEGRKRYLPWAALALAGTHFLIFRRASFFPLYGVALAIAFTMRAATYGRLTLRRAMGVASLLAIGASGTLAWAFPDFRLPVPSGPHAIGSRWLTLVDSTRLEDFVPGDTLKRSLLLRLWYPTDNGSGPVAPLMPAPQAQSLARAMNLPAYAFNHLARIPSHAHPDAQLSTKEATWPVVLFSHGFGIGFESQNTVQMEELASQGYVVVSIDHPYEAGVVAFPNGAVIRMAPHAFFDTATARKMLPLIQALSTERDTARLNDILGEMRGVTKLEPSIARWVADTRFVADHLAQWTSAAPFPDFAGRLRTDRVGVFGMSFGGATAAAFCAVDSRCATGINLDGLVFGEAVDRPISRPFLFATSSVGPYLHETYFQRAAAPAHSVTVAGSRHFDFTDFGFVSPLFVRLGVLGGIAPRRMHAIMNAAVVGMMNAHLTGRAPFDPATLTRFPEVTLRSRAPAEPAPGRAASLPPS